MDAVTTVTEYLKHYYATGKFPPVSIPDNPSLAKSKNNGFRRKSFSKNFMPKPTIRPYKPQHFATRTALYSIGNPNKISSTFIKAMGLPPQ